MALNKALKKFVQDAKDSDSYWVEKAKIDYSMALEKQRKSAGFSYADIAKKIASSAAYISKVFRGDSNLTIETMVKLARAVGGRVDIRVVSEKAATTTTTIGDWNNGAKFVVIDFARHRMTTNSTVAVANEEVVADHNLQAA